SLKTSIKTITYLSDIGCLEIQGASLTTTNLSEAQSRIQDADYATEVSNMSKAQIIQQAGNSVLSKANQVPQQVLSLLQG
ncbi:flagellin, partial [Escherichia coli]|uniref:flagellin n=1 Tax=Escherichia coli TaxID=562 RepID=UPI0023786D1B